VLPGADHPQQLTPEAAAREEIASARRGRLQRLRLERLRRVPRSVVIRLGVGAAIISSLALLHPAFIGWGMAVTAAVVAVPLSRYRAYAVAFLPYGAAWLIFTVLRSLADETPIPLRTTAVTAIERKMFFGTEPTIWLQNQLFDPRHISWYDYMTTFVHWSYFFVPHIAAILIWRSRPDLYRRFLMTMTITLGVGLLVYFLAPAAPPWLTADQAPQQDIYRVMANVGRQINSSLYDRTYSVIGDSNPVAAMPSLHTAITFMLFLFARHYGRKIGLLALAYSLLMVFSLVYTGEHYVLDTLVGAAIATYAYLITGRWLQVTAPAFRSRRRAPVGADSHVGA
jgi:membrane-associated phospholipid phosphatase